MAGRGPAPGTGAKTAGKRRRNTPRETTKISAGARRRAAPKLPRTYLTGETGPKGKAKSRQFLPRTRAWFTTLCSSAEGSQFSAVDVLYLTDVVAPLYDQYLRAPDEKRAAELRRELTQFGATPDAKKRLGWEVIDGGGEAAEGAAPSGQLATVHRLKAVDTSD